MGEVYRARDPRLDRDIAIKVLPASVSADPEALARFEREAKAVAALSHPNILAIHDFGSDNGVSYVVTELLEGETLRGKLHTGRIPQKQAVDYALQIAKGLSAAHEKGIVHRDLKPENLFVDRDGHLKILDFGLAKKVIAAAPGKETSAPTGSAHTEPGTVMGTVGYMSPEQVRGLSVDARSDIFSFGTILYEMLARERPFQRDTAGDIAAAILKEDPPELSRFGRDVSPALDHVVRHCLEKDPNRRFQSARDIAFALSEATGPSAISGPRFAMLRTRKTIVVLGAIGFVSASLVSFFVWRAQGVSAVSATPRSRPTRIVVLPFENLGAPQDAYLAAGMTEEISSRLANLQGLAVISRTTAIGYDRKGKTIKQLGGDLGVDYVLEGTLLSAGGGRMRIAPRLIQVADDTQVWGDHYDRVMSDILAVQSEVSESVVKAMGVKLVPREKSALRTASTNDMDAYDLYIRGRETARRGQSRQNLEGALKLFQAAVDRDPRFAQALAQLAWADLYIYFLHYDRNPEHVDRARRAVEQLTALGPELAETHIARAYYFYWGQLNYSLALEEFNAVRRLQPSNSDVLAGTAYILRRQGQWEKAAEQLSKWLELDPRNPTALYQYGLTCTFLRRYEEADSTLGQSLLYDPLYGNAWGFRGRLQVLRGDVEKARLVLSDARRVWGLQDDNGFVTWASFQVALIRRDFPGALRQLEEEKRESLSNQYFFTPIELLRGEVNALTGQHDLAKKSFETARRKLKELAAKEPDESRYYSALGIACAGMGLQDEAMRAAARGSELMPQSKDGWRAMWRIEDLALVHTMLGQQDEAIERLDFLLSHTGEMSTHILRLDPRWESLKSNPRFQALLVKYQNK